MRVRLSALCAGIAVHSQMPAVVSPSVWYTLPVLVAVLVAAVMVSAAINRAAASHSPDGAQRRAIHWMRHGTCAGLLLVAGFLWAMLSAQLQLAQRLPSSLEGVDFWLTGRVEGLVRRDAGEARPAEDGRHQRSQQFELRVDYSCLRLLPAHCPPGERSQVLAGQRVTLNDYAQLPLQAGERWQLRVRVNRPHGFSNPGGYDFEAGQFQRGIMARGYVRDTTFNTRLDQPQTMWARLLWQLDISRLRSALAADINSLHNINNKALLKALVIGDRDGLSNAQWELFTATGTNHLVVISGLHVGFVALCVWALFNRISRLFPSLLLYVPAQHLAAYAAMLAAAAYSLLAGFSLPTQRALIMISVLMAGRLLGRAVAPADSLLMAALLVLLTDPMAVTQAGFWLSFAAVASLFLAFTGHGYPPQGLRRHWQRWVQPQWAVSVGLLLPLLLWTGQMSLNAPVANILAIPLVSLLVVPLALAGAWLLALDMQWLAASVLRVADVLLDGLQLFLASLSAWAPGLWRPAVPSLPVMVLMALASMLLLLPRGLLPRTLAWLMLLPLVWPPPAPRPLPGRAWLQFLDVGQGLAVVVHTHRHHLLFDTGPALGPDFDAGRAVIVPYLRQLHVPRLDTLIVSHWHADHSGGLATVLDSVAVTRRLAGQATAPSSSPAHFDACEAGQHWRWDEVSFTVLYPPADGAPARRAGDINNRSCVLLIEAGNQRVLLTGDIEEPAERWLLAANADGLAVDVIQAPHHGSRSSSSAAFVQAASAHWVVMSAGYHNRFDHPHADVVRRYVSHGTHALFTADSGAIAFEIGGAEPVLLSRHREQQRRFWFNL